MEFTWREKVVEVRGKPHTYHVLEHPGSVAVVPVRDGKVALVRQLRPAVDEWLWEVPAGTLRPGEDPLAAAARELEEETGLVAGRLERAASFYLAPGYSSERMHLVFAHDLRPGHRHLDEAEVITEVRWFDPEELERMATRGQLADAKTLAALFYVRRHPGEGDGRR
ncbi:MAG: NUDIX hydrolase [Bacillota bacterium]